MMSDKPIPEPGGPRAPARLSGSDRRRGEAAVGSHLVAMPDAVVDPSRWFGDDHPVELEIGCGKGAFLVAAAEMFPGVNFVGVEVAAAFARAAAARMARRRLSNVRIVAADAGRLVGERLRSESLNAVHVYFPDPWPKKRHHKNRLISAPFPPLAKRLLRKGGIVYLRTDNIEYFEQMLEVFGDANEFEAVETPESLRALVTDFEQEFNSQGIPTNYAAYSSVGE